jgi:predicted transposase YdaD
MSFDNVCKLLAEKYPADFVRWLTIDDGSNIQVLKTELSIEPIRADSVIFIQTSTQILHIEFQTLTLSKIEERQNRQDTAAYTEILAGLRFEKGLIRQLLSEDIMQESVIYQDILQKGEQKGEQQEAFRFLNRQLNRKFGSIDSSVLERIQALSTEQLEILGEEFLGFGDVSALLDWLDDLPERLR